MVARKIKAPPRQPATPEKTNITDLPQEIILKVVEQLDLSILEVLRLRVSHRIFTPSICAHPMFSKGIEEIVLLGKIDWKEIQDCLRGYRTASEEFMWKRFPHYYGSGLFRAWPLSLESDGVPKLPSKPGGDETVEALPGGALMVPSEFEDAYGSLIQALAKLPKLSKIAFAEEKDGPGWNQTRMLSTFKKRPDPGFVPRDLNNKLRSKNGGVRIERRADAEVLAGLISCSALDNLRSLVITVELPFVCGLLQDSTTAQRLAQLRNIELHIDTHWLERTKWHVFCRDVLSSAVKLEHLRLVYRANSYITKAHADMSCLFILSGADGESLGWDSLKTFELVSQQTPGYNKKGSRCSRPLCLAFDLPAFVAAHQSTLEKVELGNVLFLGDDLSVITTLWTSVDALSRCERLGEVKWSVNRFKHHEKCKRSEESTFQDCSVQHDCGLYYSDEMGRGFGMGMLQEAAKDLCVDMGGDLTAWDFGLAVRRNG
ncbi:hypothetical protein LTR56_016210 [Elasticomyces elasticus]|nr:hypothetical protein LTR56_016210 [Elasticomyces elasticus]KAK3642169.1 hypothetical protein LTR22_016290 [Elasticomyces elasticus]KAK4914217.1 hypothetical protein LTR49_017570 [Elasticomyces elasticus]KAK5762578.1 hypothetical protein LTS12_007369 [Elasticomyces elasticus]